MTTILNNYGPALTLNQSIVVAAPTASTDLNADAPLASIRTFAASGIGSTFAQLTPAQGQLLAIVSDPKLFSVIGTIHGGDGIETFRLPNLVGRLSMGTGIGVDLQPLELGRTAGAAISELVQANLPESSGGTADRLHEDGPEVGTRYFIRSTGIAPDDMLTTTTIGVILDYAGGIPVSLGSYLPCNGAVLPIAGNEDLFAVIGATYGGDGITTFALPDLRGRTIVGADPGGLAVGQMVGQEGVVIDMENMPVEMGGSGVPLDNREPSLAMNLMIALTGFDDAILFGQQTMSEIIAFAGTDVSGFAGAVAAAGQILQISDNPDLFAMLGTTYGGDGITTFALPDLRGRSIVGAGTTISGDDFVLGQELGSATITLTLDDIPDLKFSGTSGDEALYGGNGNDVIRGLAGGDLIVGNGGNDVLLGQAGDDTIRGGEGNDVITAGDGADDIDGGNGIDTLIYAATNANIAVDLGANTIGGGDAEGDTIANIESFTAGGGNDHITGSDAANVLIGNGGNDTISGLAGNDIVSGGGGADHLDGGDDIDTLDYRGNAGDLVLNLATSRASGGDATGDTIANFENAFGGAGGDQLTGTDGANVLRGYDGDDIIEGGAGADILDGGEGSDTLSYRSSAAGVSIHLAQRTASGGDAEGDVIKGFRNVIGSGADDILVGNSSANRLIGRNGNDIIRGGGGDDFIFGGNGADKLNGGSGIDTLSCEGTRGAVTVNLGADTISGADANGETIFSFENFIGGDGDDVITGSGGANVLEGGGGVDTITGGLGADQFVLQAQFEGRDVIMDFSAGEDVLIIRASSFGAGLAAGPLSDASFAANAAGVATDASHRFILSTATGELFFDENGSDAGGARVIALFSGGSPALAAADFLIV